MLLDFNSSPTTLLALKISLLHKGVIHLLRCQFFTQSWSDSVEQTGEVKNTLTVLSLFQLGIDI